MELVAWQEVLQLIHLRALTCYEVLNTPNEQVEPNKAWPNQFSGFFFVETRLHLKAAGIVRDLYLMAILLEITCSSTSPLNCCNHSSVFCFSHEMEIPLYTIFGTVFC